MKSKIIWVLLVVAALAVGGYFYLSSNKSPELDLDKPIEETGDKTYENSQYGFELTYPKDWAYFTRKGGATTPFGMEFSDDKNYIEYGPLGPGAFPDKRIVLSLYKTPQSIAQYSSQDLAAKGAKILSKQEVKIGEIDGLVVKSEFQGTYLSAYTRKGEYIYIFESNIKNQTAFPEVEEAFNALTSNFRFIN